MQLLQIEAEVRGVRVHQLVTELTSLISMKPNASHAG